MPRVVLVDDDASIRRLVELALEGLPIELVACASVAEARAALLAAPAAMVITDLMMPGETGYELLEWLRAQPAVRGPAQLVAFSAGIDSAAHARLTALGVGRALDKPVSVAALEACVCEALALEPPAGTAAPAAVPEPARADEVRRAITDNFGGDATLYDAFRAQALTQFAADLGEGDQSLSAGDLPAVRRLAHSLKGVLALLGHDAGTGAARALERAAAAGEAMACAHLWPVLRSLLADAFAAE